MAPRRRPGTGRGSGRRLPRGPARGARDDARPRRPDRQGRLGRLSRPAAPVLQLPRGRGERRGGNRRAANSRSRAIGRPARPAGPSRSGPSRSAAPRRRKSRPRRPTPAARAPPPPAPSTPTRSGACPRVTTSIYSGVYDTKAEATKALKPLQSDFPDAKVIKVSTKGAGRRTNRQQRGDRRPDQRQGTRGRHRPG